MKKIIAVSAVAMSAALVSVPAFATANPQGFLDGGYATLDADINTPVTGYQAVAATATSALNVVQTQDAAVKAALGSTVVAQLSAYRAASLALYGNPVGSTSNPLATSIAGRLGALRPTGTGWNTATEAEILNAYLTGIVPSGNAAVTADATKYASMLSLLQQRSEQSTLLTAAETAVNAASSSALTTALTGASGANNLAKINSIENDLATKLAASQLASANLAGALSSQNILDDAAASAPHIALAANALTTDDLGANYETQVLGALVDHEDRIVSLEALTSEHTRQIAALNDRVDRLDEKVASSTATAIAMGGGAFLPDMKFNLSGNIATYDGAQAIAASIGYRVSNNVAMTASIGGGLNKGGKVGGRVGFIFGW